MRTHHLWSQVNTWKFSTSSLPFVITRFIFKNVYFRTTRWTVGTTTSRLFPKCAPLNFCKAPPINKRQKSRLRQSLPQILKNIHLEIFLGFDIVYIKQLSFFFLNHFTGYNLYQQRELSSGPEVLRYSGKSNDFTNTSSFFCFSPISGDRGNEENGIWKCFTWKGGRLFFFFLQIRSDREQRDGTSCKNTDMKSSELQYLNKAADLGPRIFPPIKSSVFPSTQCP